MLRVGITSVRSTHWSSLRMHLPQLISTFSSPLMDDNDNSRPPTGSLEMLFIDNTRTMRFLLYSKDSARRASPGEASHPPISYRHFWPRVRLADTGATCVPLTRGIDLGDKQCVWSRGLRVHALILFSTLTLLTPACQAMRFKASLHPHMKALSVSLKIQLDEKPQQSQDTPLLHAPRPPICYRHFKKARAETKTLLGLPQCDCGDAEYEEDLVEVSRTGLPLRSCFHTLSSHIVPDAASLHPWATHPLHACGHGLRHRRIDTLGACARTSQQCICDHAALALRLTRRSVERAGYIRFQASAMRKNRSPRPAPWHDRYAPHPTPSFPAVNVHKLLDLTRVALAMDAMSSRRWICMGTDSAAELLSDTAVQCTCFDGFVSVPYNYLHLSASSPSSHLQPRTLSLGWNLVVYFVDIH
ncbi:hypothetical protein R3P38DRAFT_3184037 [Favolaschia claudopus]|uniref:Uncharacterized protein n=1 Tax=Favolaschia claudopus TaxID=2862362 RepID=A0AAW0C9D1_9AGAR